MPLCILQPEGELQVAVAVSMQTTCSTVFLLITHVHVASGRRHSVDMAGAEDSVVQIVSWGGVN